MKIKRKILVVILIISFVFCSCDNIKFAASSSVSSSGSSGTMPERDSTDENTSDVTSDDSSDSFVGDSSDEHRPGEDIDNPDTPDPDMPDESDAPENPEEGDEKGGTEGNEKEEPDEPVIQTLAIPEIRIEDGILYWNAVEGATNYQIHINDDMVIIDVKGALFYELEFDYYDWIEKFTDVDFKNGVTVYVEAHANGYQPSPPSDTLTYKP